MNARPTDWRLTINGKPLEPLAAWNRTPYQGTFVGRAARADGRADSPLTVERRRLMGAGILEEITVRNYAPVPARCVVALSVDTDFADLFEVKDGRARRQWEQTRRSGRAEVSIEGLWQGVRKGVVVRAAEADVGPEGLLFRGDIPGHGEWTVRVPSTSETDLRMVSR